jgi:hypothetical protein
VIRSFELEAWPEILDMLEASRGKTAVIDDLYSL